MEEPAGKGVLIFIHAITVLLFMDTNSRGINSRDKYPTANRRARARPCRETD